MTNVVLQMQLKVSPTLSKEKFIPWKASKIAGKIAIKNDAMTYLGVRPSVRSKGYLTISTKSKHRHVAKFTAMFDVKAAPNMNIRWRLCVLRAYEKTSVLK